MNAEFAEDRAKRQGWGNLKFICLKAFLRSLRVTGKKDVED